MPGAGRRHGGVSGAWWAPVSLLLLAPAPAWALPPQLVVSVGSALGVPLAALALAALITLSRRLGLWAVGGARVGALVAGSLAAGLGLWLLLAPRSAWLPCDQWTDAEGPRYELAANRPQPGGPAPLPLLDLRRRADFRRSHVPGAVHLGAPPSETEASPAELAEVRALLTRRAAAIARHHPDSPGLALSCYQGCTAQTLVPGLRAAGLEAWSIHQGFAALRRFQPTTRASWAALPPLRVVDRATAARWIARGALQEVALSAADAGQWMDRPDGALAPELPPGAPPIFAPAARAWLRIAAARWDREGVAALWIDPEAPAPPAALAVVHAAGDRLEAALGRHWWLLLALAAAGLQLALGWADPVRALAREPFGRAGRVAPATGGLAVLVAAGLAGGSLAWRGVPSAAVGLWPALLVGLGAAAAAGLDREQRLRALVARLRPTAPGQPPAPARRGLGALVVPALVGTASGGLAAALPLPVAGTAAVLLWGAPAVELLRVLRWQRQVDRGQAAAVARLLLPPGLPVGTAESHVPGAPGQVWARPEGSARMVRAGLFSGIPTDQPDGPPLALARAVARAARGLGRDLRLVVDAQGPALSLLPPPPETPETPDAERGAWRVHRQLLALAPPAPGAARGPLLDAARFAEAAPRPRALGAELLARRVGPGGGALRAAHSLGLARRPAALQIIGDRIYDRVDGPALGAGGAGRLLRWTAGLALELAAWLAPRWHLGATQRRMAQARSGPAGLIAALRALPAEGAWLPELVALAATAAPGPSAPSGPVIAGPVYGLGPDGLASPPPVPPPLPGRPSAPALRAWLRALAAAEHARLGAALAEAGAQLGLGDAVFSLTVDELAAAFASPAGRESARAHAQRRARDRALAGASAHPLPARLDVAALEALGGAPAAPPRVLAGEVSSGRARLAGGPLSATVAAGPPGPGSAVVTAMPTPAALVAWSGAGVAAVIAEEGGPLSHAAIVARELGLVLVTGVHGALSALPPGTALQLDATGTVQRGPRPAARPLWCPLDAAGTGATAAGGKARMLARMRAAGLRVPDGVVVLPTALDAALQALGAPGPGPGPAPEALADGRLPDALTAVLDAVLGAPALAGAGSLIVRSSAEVEDGQGHSFAGLFHSAPAPAHRAELAAAVARCWAAAWGPAVHDYARARGISDELRLALVVQRAVAGPWGGVLFTAAPGGGPPVVTATPGGAAGAVAGAQAGAVHGPLAGLALPAPLVAALGEVIGPAEALVGGPADVEWVWDGAALWLVQARPAAG